MSSELYFDYLEAPTPFELDIMLENFMHDKLIVRERYCFNGLFYGVHLIYIELKEEN